MEEVKISVRPVPNGHVLKVGSNEYMYYTVAALLEGFMYHVGLEELSAIDAETMREFLAASVVWKDQGETVKKLVEANKENESLLNKVNNLKKQVNHLSKKLRGEDEYDE